MKIVPRNWRDFQHYKDRNPPWIRLHRGLLDNKEFNALPAVACKVLVMLWLVASENTDGVFDDDAEDLAFRLRMPLKDIQQSLSQLKAKRFLVAASAQEEQEDGRPLSKIIAEKNGFGSRHISDKVKREVWERDGGACKFCASKEDLEFDHVTPVSRGGNSELENIQLLCRPCNRKKRAKTAEQVATPAQPWLELRTSETETETEAETEAFQRAETEAEALQVAGKPRAKRSTAAPVSSDAWDSYSTAYQARYGAEPVRNSRVNGQLAQFVGRISAEEAPLVAAFYVGHQNGLYVSAMHPVNLLLRDAEKLRTEWATKRQITRAEANQADRTQTNANAFGALIAEARQRESEDAKLNAA